MQAKKLVEAARESIGVKSGRETINLSIWQHVEHLEMLNEQIEKIDGANVAMLQKVPCSANILSIKGIGNTSAAGIIGEVGGFENFSTIKELLKHAGLNLCSKSSGKQKGVEKISKMGRSQLRKILFFIALRTVAKGGIMREYYERLLSKGKPKMKALIAVCRKLLGLIFALVRDNGIFEKEYTKESQKQSA